MVVFDVVPQRGSIFAGKRALPIVAPAHPLHRRERIFDSVTRRHHGVFLSFLQMSPPQSLAQCVVAGKLSAARFLQLRAASCLCRCRRNLRKRLLRRHLSNSDNDDDHDSNATSKNRPPQHRAKRCVWGRIDESGKKVPLKPQESLWYMMYVCNPLINQDVSMHAKFRKRFRIPYANYLELVELCTSDYRFQKWCGFKKNNKRASPIELLVLGALRYLGRGFTFDDIEECTAISCEVH